MAKQLDYMMNMVKEYLDDGLSRLSLELDINYEIIMRYEEMERENSELAEAFNYLIIDNGVDVAVDLSDKDFIKLIEKQYSKMVTLIEGGLF